VAQSDATPPQFVVAIAGTNYNSVFDVLIEDVFVGAQVRWETGTPPAGSAPKISAGTFAGLTILQFLTPGPGMPGANQLLVPFLTSVATAPITVITSGHSLGGALSPALALWLHDTRAGWDPKGNATIFCEPTAGPTAGNADFAAYYGQALGSRTGRIVNSLDIVPHAWDDNGLAQLPDLYEPDIDPDLAIQALVAAARVAASGGHYAQIDVTTPPLSGSMNTAIINPQSYAFENYLVQAGYQHIDEYFTLTGVTIDTEAMAVIREGMGVPAAARASVRLRATLVRRQAIPAGAA
jgi:hypothetical protein